MCGIAGIVDFSENSIDERIVMSMSKAMINRGPDSSGHKKFKNAILAHRRLSVVDLSENANQPMHDKENDNTIVFNGEIYNHKSIRYDLIKTGFQYRSRSDTESILFGYKNYGSKIASKIRGMWAFAIWDNASSTLFLSRDRFGEKPLYYCLDGKRLAFASSLSALEPALNNKDINPEAVLDLLSYEYIPTKHSIYKNVKKLPAGCNLTFNKNGLLVEEYFNLNYRKKIKVSENDALIEIDRLISQSVKEQLVADVPVGVFLSGGVDSGLISAVASKYKKDLTAITMTVPHSIERDESLNAREIARKNNINLIEVPLNQDCIKNLPKLLSNMEPFGDSSLIPLSAISKKAKEIMTVVLTGDGGDEGFGGYGQPSIGFDAMKIRSSSNNFFLKMLAPFYNFFSHQRIHPIFKYLRLHSSKSMLAATNGIEGFINSKSAMSKDVKNLIFGPVLNISNRESHTNHLLELLKKDNHSNWYDALFQIGIKSRLVDDFLYKVDSASMNYSLETRAPLLDHRILSFAASLPQRLIIPNSTDKYLLKKVATVYNPKKIVYSPKKGFSIPVEKYFTKGWKTLLSEMITDGISAQMGLLEPKGVVSYMNKHGLRQNQRIDRQLFTILSLEIWLRVFHQRSEDPEELGEKLLYFSKK